MKKNPKRYTIRKRKDCDRWEVIVRDPAFGQLYGGLHKTREDAIRWLKDNLIIPR